MNKRFLDLANTLAGMTRDGEDGYVAASDDSLPEAMDRLIAQARAAVGKTTHRGTEEEQTRRTREALVHAFEKMSGDQLRALVIELVPDFSAYSLGQFYRKFVIREP